MAVPGTKPQFYRRTLPETCISFCSDEGKTIFAEALFSGHMEVYFGLAAQFRTQDEPAFCGLSTLVMVLNTLEVDPGRVWKGPWRWYHEHMLECCIPLQVIEQNGITMDQFACLASCNTLDVTTIRASPSASEDDFRNSVEECARGNKTILAVSYSRKVLGQTGDGHFSPIAGYHKDKDLVLILDTARFKYPPHWVKLPLLFEAMKSLDKSTGLPRGYHLLSKSSSQPLLVFEISRAIGITVTPEKAKTEAAQLLQALNIWTTWLAADGEIDSENEEDILLEAVKVLKNCFCGSALEDSLLSVKTELKCSASLSEEHSCALEEVIISLGTLTLFQNIKRIASKMNLSLEDSKCTAPVIIRCIDACIVNEACTNLISSISVYHCFTMVLLSWPYINSENSRASVLCSLMSAQLTETSAALQNEVVQLRKQLSSVLCWFSTGMNKQEVCIYGQRCSAKTNK